MLALVELTEEAPGANCPTGGTRVDYGIDINGDGLLDAEEIDGTDYVCSDGDVLIETEQFFEVGFGCEQGYEVTLIGVDDVTVNGTLEPAEVDNTLRACLPDDYDGDGWLNVGQDNCPGIANELQLDTDLDGEGDVCETDPKTLYAFTRGVNVDPAVYKNYKKAPPIGSGLYAMDLEAGTATMIGSTGHSLTAIRFNPADGLLYGMTRKNDDGKCDVCLVRIDPATAVSTVLTEVRSPEQQKSGVLSPYPSIAFLSDGSLYAWGEAPDRLVSVNTTTGLATDVKNGPVIDSYGHSLSTMNDDRLLFVNGDSIHIIDPLTGQSTALDPTPGRSESRGILNPDTLLHIGVDSAGQHVPVVMDVLQMSTTDAPEVLYSVDIPDGLSLHGLALEL